MSRGDGVESGRGARAGVELGIAAEEGLSNVISVSK